MKEIKDMTIEELDARSAEIVAEVENPETTEERLKELEGVSIEIEAKKDELRTAASEAKEVREAVAESKVVVGEIKDIIKEDRKMSNKEVCASAEYREAFKNYVMTGKDAECRALLTENVGTGVVRGGENGGDIVKNRSGETGVTSSERKSDH